MTLPPTMRRVLGAAASLVLVGLATATLTASPAQALPAPDCSAESASFNTARDIFRPAQNEFRAARAARADALAAFRADRSLENREAYADAEARRLQAKTGYDMTVADYRSTLADLKACRSPIVIETGPVSFSPNWGYQMGTGMGAPVVDITVRGLIPGVYYLIETPDYCGSRCGPGVLADPAGVIGYHPEFPIGDCSVNPTATSGTVNIIRMDNDEVVATRAIPIPEGTCPIAP